MSVTKDIPEETLLAWYHDEITGAEAEAVAAAVAANPELRAKIDDWQAQDGALGALFAPVAREPVPARLAAAARPAPARPWVRVAAMAGLFAIGLSAGWGAGRLAPGTAPTTARLAEAAIAAHETYVVEVLHPVEVQASEAEHLIGWVAKRLGQEIAPPDFAAQGFRLMGGRVLPGETGAAAMFLYESDAGQRVSLYVAPTGGDGETAFQFTGTAGVQSFWWVDRDLSYAVVGDVPRAALRAIAVAAYDQLI